MQRTIERIRSKMGRTNRMLVAGVLVFGLLLGLFSVLLSLDVVTITDSNGASQTLITTSRQPEEILLMAGVDTDQNDEIIYTDNGANGASILINRSFPVNVEVDGLVYTMEANDGTVADALMACSVELGTHDFVEPGLEAELFRGMAIEVRRVSFREESQRIEVSEEDLAAYLETLSEEEQAAFVNSKSRIYDAVSNLRLIDGEVTGSEILRLEAVYHPYDEPSAGFEAGVPVSTIDGFIGIEIDENGVPTSYSSKMESAICTAYSASAGRGAGGQGLYCGTVAVNPNVIPYGTRLYITAADNSFVYGFAIASDCGTAMMEGYVDIDLYFESNTECGWFGKRQLDVYILD